MKKVLILSLLSLTVLGTMQSCKKGENDPFLSMRTRKARIAGEWTISSWESKSVSTSENGSSTTTSTYNGTTQTTVTVNTMDGNTTTNTSTSDYMIKYTFEKNGAYKAIYTADGQTEMYEGTWIFLKKSKEDKLKDKEAILLTQTSYTDSEGISTIKNLSGEVIVIDQLKNKEMIWTSETIYSNQMTSETETDKITLSQD